MDISGLSLFPSFHPQGSLLPRGARGASIASTGTLRTPAEARALSDTFAEDIKRRLEAQAVPKVEEVQATGTGTAQAPGSGDKDAGKLAKSLAGAVDFVRNHFGSAAATAVMGLVYKNVGDGPITEDTIGDGLVDALKFIDRNFGMEAGDKVMDYFNGRLNNALNDYFQNGKSERFMAVYSPGQGSPVSAAMAPVVATVQEKYGQDAAETVAGIVEAQLADGLTPGKLRKGLKKALDWLQEAYAQDGSLSGTFGQSMASALEVGNTEPSQSSSSLTGVTLDITV